jgi:hypothetical protein
MGVPLFSCRDRERFAVSMGDADFGLPASFLDALDNRPGVQASVLGRSRLALQRQPTPVVFKGC